MDMSFIPACDDETDVVTVVPDNGEVAISPRILPQYVGEISVADSRSTIERMVDMFAPYKELCEATEEGDIEKVLGRLLTEWYVVGASVSFSQFSLESRSYVILSPVIGCRCVCFPDAENRKYIDLPFRLNATVFGLSSGTLFQVDGLARRCVAFGSIASGLGIISDAWFLVAYSGANAAKFEVIYLPCTLQVVGA